MAVLQLLLFFWLLSENSISKTFDMGCECGLREITEKELKACQKKNSEELENPEVVYNHQTFKRKY